MKRAILLLTAVALGTTGCNTCDYNDLAIYWHFQNPAGAGELACRDAGVARVAIYIDGNLENTFDCVQPDVNGNPVQGVTLLTFDRHWAYHFDVQGLDTAGSVVYESAFTYTSSTCGLDRRDTTLTALPRGNLTLDYSLVSPAGCSQPTASSAYRTTFIWFELLDQNGNVYSSVGPSTDPRDETLIPCDDQNPTIFIENALLGGYTVSRIQEVEIQSGLNNPIVVFHAECGPSFYSFTHAQDGETVYLPGIRGLPVGSTYSCWR